MRTIHLPGVVARARSIGPGSDGHAGEEELGALTYDRRSFSFDDRLLAHLQIVIVQKLQRRESLLLSWVKATGTGSGRTSIWLDHTIPVQFDFAGSRSPTIGREWLAVLSASADSSFGLLVVDPNGDLLRCGAPAVEDRSARRR